jgi:zinc finger CCHC domain-containing protein 8
MASEEFISLGAPGEADVTDGHVGELQHKAAGSNGAEPVASELQPEGGASAVTDGQMGELQDKDVDVNGAEPLASKLPPEGEASVGGSSPKASDANIDLEEGRVEDMDLGDDDVVVVKHQKLDALVQSETSVTAIHGFLVELDKGNEVENALIDASTTISADESCIL